MSIFLIRILDVAVLKETESVNEGIVAVGVSKEIEFLNFTEYIATFIFLQLRNALTSINAFPHRHHMLSRMCHDSPSMLTASEVIAFRFKMDMTCSSFQIFKGFIGLRHVFHGGGVLAEGVYT